MLNKKTIIIDFIIFYFFVIFAVFASNEINIVSLKDIDKINKNVKYDKLLTIKNGKIEIDQTPERIFLFSKEKYYTNVTYNEQIRNIGSKNKDFFEKWLKAKYLNDSSLNNANIDTNITLINKQINIFYKEILIYDEGKLYNFLIQLPLAAKMHKELTKNKKIKIEFINLGKDVLSGDNFFVITNYFTDNIIQNIVVENDFIDAKRLIDNEQYDAAILKLNNFLKKYPNHLEARKEVCLTKYLKSLKINNLKSNAEIIKCYKDLTKMYENESVFYALASLYYTDKSLGQAEKQNNILKYTSKVISLLRSKNLNDSLKMIYYNSLYLRGITKIMMNNSDGLTDLKLVQDERPDLISMDLFMK